MAVVTLLNAQEVGLLLSVIDDRIEEHKERRERFVRGNDQYYVDLVDGLIKTLRTAREKILAQPLSPTCDVPARQILSTERAL